MKRRELLKSAVLVPLLGGGLVAGNPIRVLDKASEAPEKGERAYIHFIEREYRKRGWDIGLIAVGTRFWHLLWSECHSDKEMTSYLETGHITSELLRFDGFFVAHSPSLEDYGFLVYGERRL